MILSQKEIDILQFCLSALRRLKHFDWGEGVKDSINNFFCHSSQNQT